MANVLKQAAGVLRGTAFGALCGAGVYMVAFGDLSSMRQEMQVGKSQGKGNGEERE